VPDKSAPDRTLSLTQGELGALSVAFLVGIPLVLAASGMLIWWRRRRR
jgi:LPXTG-motif cell wall-anchored protein